MDIKRYLILMLGSFAMAGSANAGVNAAIVKLNEEGPNYLYSARKINPGDSIQFQIPKNDQPSCCGRSDWKAVTALAADPDAINYASDQPLYRYRLNVAGISTTLPFIGIAVIGSKVSTKQDGDGKIEAREGGTATALILCTSEEGIHVVSRSGGKQDSHLYVYLGYDIENPNCTATLMK